jgi:exosortase E/protease (VPEID-CTERM system)
MWLLYNNPRLATPESRWALLALILVIECILCGLVIRAPDLLPPYDGSRPFFLTFLGEVVRMGFAALPLLLLLLSRRSNAIARELSVQQGYSWQPWLACHAVAFTGFVYLTWPVFGPSTSIPEVSRQWVIGWGLLAASALLFLLFAAAPPIRWIRLVRMEWVAILVSAFAGVLIWHATLKTQQLWQLGADMTLRCTRWLLLLIYPHLVYYPPNILSTDSFIVQIFGPCSGYEGVTLISVFGATYLWLFRASLRFPRALLLIPIGIVALWTANVLRIAAIVVIGSSISPDLALHSFHSYAGWIGFSVIALGVIALSHHTVLRDDSKSETMPAVRETRPALALLVPLLVLFGCSLVVSAVSTTFVALYPLIVLPTALALWHFRGYYAPLAGKPSWQAILTGVIVFAVWMSLVAPENGDGTKLAAKLAQMPLWLSAVWLAIRVIGSVIVVPMAEELAFRGYLIRKLVARDFEQVRPGHFTWLSFVVSSLLFGLLHHSWMAGTLAGAGFAVALYQRGQLRDAIVAHMTSNALIAVWAIAFGMWSLWT